MQNQYTAMQNINQNARQIGRAYFRPYQNAKLSSGFPCLFIGDSGRLKLESNLFQSGSYIPHRGIPGIAIQGPPQYDARSGHPGKTATGGIARTAKQCGH